jgi:hypothetical protein
MKLSKPFFQHVPVNKTYQLCTHKVHSEKYNSAITLISEVERERKREREAERMVEEQKQREHFGKKRDTLFFWGGGSCFEAAACLNNI